ncbi:hypothetical protein MLD38_036731 [Melastoma candidum]|uniref:Uncharacterized protein n=1 Tax=Melastoma candidum TaxID=119954 RepID=A0ACB9LJY1_9MYRT|nr:hypothetical protein MLD38_036731 [Melastoma candidum]
MYKDSVLRKKSKNSYCFSGDALGKLLESCYCSGRRLVSGHEKIVVFAGFGDFDEEQRHALQRVSCCASYMRELLMAVGLGFSSSSFSNVERLITRNLFSRVTELHTWSLHSPSSSLDMHKFRIWTAKAGIPLGSGSVWPW